MMSVQNRLFSFTRNDDLLIGLEVAKASRTKQIVKALQKDKQMAEDWRLDIFCRDPQIITDMEVRSVEPGTALGPRWNYCISLVLTPVSKCLGTYTLAVAWFGSRDEAEAMLDTVRHYITLRYGVYHMFNT